MYLLELQGMKGCKALRHRFPLGGFDSFYSFFFLSLSHIHKHTLTHFLSLSTLSPVVSFSPFLSFVALRGKCFSAITFSKKKVRVSQQYKIKDGGFGELISYLSQINTEREKESVCERGEERGKGSGRSHSSSVFTSSFSFFFPHQ